MGQDKALLDWGGRPAIAILSDLARHMGAESVMAAGADLGLPFVLDPTPYAGPVAGIVAAAGLLAAQGMDRLLVLAIDAPAVTDDDLHRLLDAPSPGAVYLGHPLPAVLSVAAIPAWAEPNWSLNRLAADAKLNVLDCGAASSGRLRGANTPDERSALLSIMPKRLNPDRQAPQR